MNIRKNSLANKIWLYLIIFSISILFFLWLFQVVFLDKFYEYSKAKDLKTTTNLISINYFDDNYENLLDALSYKKGVCIEIIDHNVLVYASSDYNQGCMTNKNFEINTIKTDFINSNVKSKKYSIVNKRFNNQTLLYALRLEDNIYAFVNASLEPLDAATNILVKQMMYVTIIVLLLSLAISYYISKNISKPIINLNKTSKELAQGKYDVTFKSDSDIKEIKDLETTLNEAKDTIAKAEDLRRELMANVSHDLKTPLTMIKAYAEMVKDLTYDDKEKSLKNLSVIIEETNRLNELVNDILEFSKIQANTNTYKYEKFDLNILINDILNRYNVYVEKDNYEFIYKNKKSINVIADKKRIEQVLYNLINNAINYTGDDKKVFINVKDLKKSIRIEIQDTGSGINEKDINLIWDKYYQTDKKHKRVEVGTGLGLSIVKNILINHKANYGVESSKNGTIFYFELKKA